MKSATVRSAAVTDAGNLRGNNEDRVYIDEDRGVYLVIDGVGGQAGGERAAAVAEQELVARLQRSTGSIEDRIREGIALAGKRILEQARRSPELKGMACVLTVAVVADGEAVIGHVGDTRLYKIRRGVIEKITRDHSPVGAREDAGEISEREAMQHPRRNEIFRDVGSEEHGPNDLDFVDVQRIPFEPDAALLLCSDGLTDQVSSAQILDTAARCAGDPSWLARELVRLANEAGGKDNVSVVYVEGPAVAPPRVDEDTRPSPPAPRRVWPWMLAALLLGAAAMGLAWRFWPVEVPSGPRVLAVPDVYPLIAGALADARAGDIIEVSGGTYREQVELKEGVRLIAAGNVVLEPKADASQPGAAIVVRNIKSGSVSGFHINVPAGSGVSAGVLVTDSDVELTGLDIQGAGILIRGSSRPTIRGSRIHHTAGTAISIEGDAAPRIFSNIVADNAVGLSVSGQPVVAGNIFANNARDFSPDSPDLLKHNVIVQPGRRPSAGAGLQPRSGKK